MCLAVPGKIISIEGDDPLLRSGKVDFAGAVKHINLAYVPEARIGDYVLVHVGFAISRIDEQQARETLAALAEIAALDELAEPGDAESSAGAEETGRSGVPGAKA